MSGLLTFTLNGSIHAFPAYRQEFYYEIEKSVF